MLAKGLGIFLVRWVTSCRYCGIIWVRDTIYFTYRYNLPCRKQVQRYLNIGNHNSMSDTPQSSCVWTCACHSLHSQDRSLAYQPLLMSPASISRLVGSASLSSVPEVFPDRIPHLPMDSVKLCSTLARFIPTSDGPARLLSLIQIQLHPVTTPSLSCTMDLPNTVRGFWWSARYTYSTNLHSLPQKSIRSTSLSPFWLGEHRNGLLHRSISTAWWCGPLTGPLANMRDIFNHPLFGWKVNNQLLELHPAAEVAVKFCTQTLPMKRAKSRPADCKGEEIGLREYIQLSIRLLQDRLWQYHFRAIPSSSSG